MATSLPHRKLIDALEVVREVHAALHIDELRSTIPRAISRLIAADRVSLDQVELDANRRVVIPNPVPSYWGRLGEVFRTHVMEHPIWRVQRNHLQPIAFSDCRHDPRWARSALYHEYHRPIGVRHQLSAFVHADDHHPVGVAFNRSRRDFGEADRAVCKLLIPHLRLAWRNALRRHEAGIAAGTGIARSRLITVDCSKRMVVHAGSRGVRVRQTGSPEREAEAGVADPGWRRPAPPRSDALHLAPGDHLPDEIHHWLQVQRRVLGSMDTFAALPDVLCLRQGESMLSFRLVGLDVETATLLVSEHPALELRGPARENRDTGLVAANASERNRLTARETEILHWIAEGKRNAEIAIIFGISSRTIGKHVEHVLQKLGVETRTAAARYAQSAR